MLDKREADFVWVRAELEKKRAEYIASIERQHSENLQAIREIHASHLEQLNKLELRWNQSEARWEKAVNELCSRLETLEAVLRSDIRK